MDVPSSSLTPCRPAMAPFLISFFLCLTGLLSRTLAFTLVTEPGQNVTFWCQHDLRFTGSITWYKHTNTSVPRLLGCRWFSSFGSGDQCPNSPEPEGVVISQHGRNVSLTITAVDLSDSGLYFCVADSNIFEPSFSHFRYLDVKEGNEKLSKASERETEGLGSCSVCWMLIGVLGVVNVILLCVLIFILLKHRKTQKGLNADPQDNRDSDSLNYASLHFQTKKTKKTERIRKAKEPMEQQDIYSAVR